MKEGKTAAAPGGGLEGRREPTDRHTAIGAPTNNSRDYQQPQCCHKHKQTNKNRRVSHKKNTLATTTTTQRKREREIFSFPVTSFAQMSNVSAKEMAIGSRAQFVTPFSSPSPPNPRALWNLFRIVWL